LASSLGAVAVGKKPWESRWPPPPMGVKATINHLRL
jgi:hypothetical protein